MTTDHADREPPAGERRDGGGEALHGVDLATLAAAVTAALEERRRWRPPPSCPAACETLREMAARWLLVAVALRHRRDALPDGAGAAVARERLTRRGWAWYVAAGRCDRITTARAPWLLAWLASRAGDPVVGADYARARSELAVWLLARALRDGGPVRPCRPPKPIPPLRRRGVNPPPRPGE